MGRHSIIAGSTYNFFRKNHK